MISPSIAFPSAFAPEEVQIADLFCGAGGTSSGAVEAISALGKKPVVTAVNHWPVAIDTHTANHPGARHFCTGIDNVNPSEIYKDGVLHLLWASPECTHHSVARGGKPINDQSRATAWCVVRWAEKLLPPVILVENVPEFQTWGAIGSNGRPLASKKGETFQAWLNALRSLGYKVDYQVLCAADYGDPTTRTRLFVQAVRGRRKIVWPNKTHSKGEDLFAKRRWTPAREIIDWSLEGTSIFDRKKPLSDKTLARIEAGLRKYGLKGFTVRYQGNHTGRDESARCAQDLNAPLSTVDTSNRFGLAQPFIVPNFGEREGQTPRTHGVESPLPAVTSHGAGALVQPYICAFDNGSSGPESGLSAIEDPISTIVTKARHGVAEPFLVELRGSGPRDHTAKSIDDPCGTVTANGNHHAIAQPFLVNMKGQSDAADINAPAPTVTAHAPHLYMAEPFLVKTANGANGSGEGSRTKSLDEPMPTVCGNRGDVALIEPFIMSAGGPECGARPVSEPVGTVLTRDHRALVEPCLLPQQSAGALRSVNDPAPTVAAAGAIALVDPLLIDLGGNPGKRPIVELDGKRYHLDIRFRMLQPHELALAQGFPRHYRFTGTKSDQVKQIGNAVPRRLARALVAAVLTQDPDVSWLVDAEEQSDLLAKSA